jgi:uncharacterized iron-regulated membrane protein
MARHFLTRACARLWLFLNRLGLYLNRFRLVSRAQLVQKAQALFPASQEATPESLSCMAALNLCSVEFGFTPQRLINTRVFLAASDGAIIQVQGEDDSPGDKFLSLQFALHSGQIAGTAGRLIVTCWDLRWRPCVVQAF